MPIERRMLERTLRELGFHADDGDHRRFVLRLGANRVIRTMTSRGVGHRTIGEDIVAKVARQMHITRAFLYELVRGIKTREDYLEELRKQGLLD